MGKMSSCVAWNQVKVQQSQDSHKLAGATYLCHLRKILNLPDGSISCLKEESNNILQGHCGYERRECMWSTGPGTWDMLGKRCLFSFIPISSQTPDTKLESCWSMNIC